MESPKQFLKEFNHKDIFFKVDKFEELMLQDIAQFDENTQKKLYRDLTEYFAEWIQGKLEAKEQVKVSIKGSTRAGKSLIGLKIMRITTKFYSNLKFDTSRIVCANQKELRQKLQKAEFGESFLIDENAFANVGAGSITEMQQLKDINGIIAKNNNHMVYITPSAFLNVGAELGLQYFGKDTKNWLSRFLLFSTKQMTPILLGYVIFDVGSLFQDTGCYVYKYTGGCTNPNRLNYSDIKSLHNGEIIKNSSCINLDKHLNKIIDTQKTCPFYEICTSQMCNYEHKKDKWIEREMRGGLDEREKERLEVALKLFKLLYQVYEDEKTGEIKKRLNAKNGKQLKIKIKMKIHTLTSSKFTGVEIDEIVELVLSMLEPDFLEDVCKQLEIDFKTLCQELE